MPWACNTFQAVRTEVDGIITVEEGADLGRLFRDESEHIPLLCHIAKELLVGTVYLHFQPILLSYGFCAPVVIEVSMCSEEMHWFQSFRLNVFFYLFPQLATRLTFCPFKTVTGIPCPACGTTRATLQLLDGHWLDALYTNPLVLITHLLIWGSMVWMVVDVVRDKETFIPVMQTRWNPWILIPILILLALNMWWNYVKGL